MPRVEFSEYLANIGSVAGWLIDTTAVLSHALMEHQTAIGVSGNACEIGVHHGRYFIALALGLSTKERGIAIDLFEAQDQNVDRSGRGDRAMFEQNVARFLDLEDIVAMQGNSLNISGADILAQGRVRFFSVDGSHTAAATINDIRLAEACLAEGGIVAVDDLFNPAWTGVITALADYIHGAHGLQPFAFVPNKLFLCRPTDAPGYRDFLKSRFRAAILKKDAEFMGSTIDVYTDIPGLRDGKVPAPPPPPKAGSAEAGRSKKDAKIARLEAELSAIKSSRRYRLGGFLARLAGRHN
jgi:hypothetical protein